MVWIQEKCANVIWIPICLNSTGQPHITQSKIDSHNVYVSYENIWKNMLSVMKTVSSYNYRPRALSYIAKISIVNIEQGEKSP